MGFLIAVASLGYRAWALGHMGYRRIWPYWLQQSSCLFSVWFLGDLSKSSAELLSAYPPSDSFFHTEIGLSPLPSQGYHSLSASSQSCLTVDHSCGMLCTLGGLTPYQLLPPSLLWGYHFLCPSLEGSWDLVLTPFLSHFMPCSWETTSIPGALYIYYLSIHLTICQWLPILISPELTP